MDGDKLCQIFTLEKTIRYIHTNREWHIYIYIVCVVLNHPLCGLNSTREFVQEVFDLARIWREKTRVSWLVLLISRSVYPLHYQVPGIGESTGKNVTKWESLIRITKWTIHIVVRVEWDIFESCATRTGMSNDPKCILRTAACRRHLDYAYGSLFVNVYPSDLLMAFY